jgi:hypothetical protein
VGYPLPKKRIDANDIEYIDDIDTVRHGNPKCRSTYSTGSVVSCAFSMGSLAMDSSAMAAKRGPSVMANLHGKFNPHPPFTSTNWCFSIAIFDYQRMTSKAWHEGTSAGSLCQYQGQVPVSRRLRVNDVDVK